MPELTEKQIYAREYYRKNREKIKQSKRDGYSKKKSPPPRKVSFNTSPIQKKPTAEVSSPRKASAEEAQKAQVRSRIEDIELARELGINLEDL